MGVQTCALPILYSRKVLTEIIDIGGWEEDGSLSPVQKDRLMEEIRGRTLVTSPRADLVQISYRDVHPERAYEVTKAMSSLFIRATLSTKERASREAYEFIDKKGKEYNQKTTDADDNLQEYRDPK